MSNKSIYCKIKEYKYELKEDYYYVLPGKFRGHSFEVKGRCGHTGAEILFLKITPENNLVIYKGYKWDGPSGPTIDSSSFMRGSLVHDALYQLIREGKLEYKFRKPADKILKEICKQDGMPFWRRNYVYWGVRAGGKSSAKAKADEKYGKRLTAPKD